MRFFLSATVTVILLSAITEAHIPAQTLSSSKEERLWVGNPFDIKPLYKEPDTVSVVFIGDVMMHEKQLHYDCAPFLEKIRSRLEGADLAVANMEFTLAGPPFTGYPAFSAPDSYAAYAASCGIDVFLTANNHILDKGVKGLRRTLERYREMKDSSSVFFTGTSGDSLEAVATYPLILAVKGVRIAFVNFTYGTNAHTSAAWPKVNLMEKPDIGEAMDRAKKRGADFIVALPHWGEEYRLNHSKKQEEMAAWLSSAGADAIIGAHPHVVQDSTLMRNADGRDVPVFYSLGNAVSNMSARDTRLELMVTLRFLKDSRGEVSMLPPKAEYLWCTLPGRLSDSYATIPVADFIGKRNLWKSPSDYDEMIRTYTRVKKAVGINDNIDAKDIYNEENNSSGIN